MEERQVTVDGETHELPEPFAVIATQNPIEQEGTFELPEAQRDRFTVKAEMGYPERDGELRLIDRRLSRETQAPTAERVTDVEGVRALQAVPEEVRVEAPVREYVVDLGRATRTDDRVRVGVSPRGVQRLVEAARARATIRGREFVVPEDVKRVVHPVFDHRVVLTAAARIDELDPSTVVDSAVESVPVPAMDEL
jgi:MoxR-like ATPase